MTPDPGLGRIMNARMYAVTPAVEAAWTQLLGHITADAGLTLDYVPYPAPQPLHDLWARPDLGCVFMCGYPIALKLADVIPIAAPIPSAASSGGRPVYRSNIIVRADSPYQTLEDTFGGRAGWTVEHSHSGFNAFRRLLLDHRTPERPNLYSHVVGNLITARAVLDAVLDGRIDVGPLDGYWHDLIATHRPDLTADVRVLTSTDLAPIPAFVASQSGPPELVARLKSAFAAAATRPWFQPLAATLRLRGFASVDDADFTTTLEWDRAARAAGYPHPA